MIYITRNQSTKITTDSVVDYSPSSLTIYLDDVLLGTYTNTSDSVYYLQFTIPVADISGYQQREYTMKIQSSYATLKQELVIVRDYTEVPIVEVTKTKVIKFYEG